MNRIFLILFLLLSGFVAFCQTYPIVNRANSSITVQDARFSAQYNLFTPKYADTTAANSQLGNDSLSAVVFTYASNSLWVRVNNGVAGGKKWIEVGTGSGGFTNPMTTAGDMIIGGASGVAQRLAIGTNGYVLTSNGTTMSWQPSAGGTTIYTGDGTLSGNREIDGDGNTLGIINLSGFLINDGTVSRIASSTTQTIITSPNSSNYVSVSNVAVEVSGTSILTSLSGNGSGLVAVDNDGVLSFTASGAGTVTSVSGVSNRITITGTPTVNPTVDIAATYVGQTSITTLGTIATGTWSATAIAATRGGTGQTSYSIADLLYASSTTALSKLPIGNAGEVLTSNGSGLAMSWQPVPDFNLLVSRAGSGIQTWYSSGDTLYLKDADNSTFISSSTASDSSLVWSLSATGTPSSSTYLRGDNTWATIAGGGDVSKVGTPVNNQIGIWTGDGTIEGVSAVQYNGTTFGIGGTMAASAILDLTSTSQGLLVPRMTTTQKNAISSPANGLLVYDTDFNSFYFHNGVSWGTFGGANVNLSNLSSVAINTTLVSDADQTDDIGSTSAYWNHAFFYDVRLKGTNSQSVLIIPSADAGDWTFTLPPDNGDNGEFLQTDGNGVTSWVAAAGSGTVTSVGWTGGIVSIANATTTPAFTIAGTSGGIPYFSSSSTWASSGALTASAIVVGGGAGATPTVIALGTANQMLGMNNGATANEYKTLAVGTSGSDFAIAHTANTVTFNLPDASASNRGAVTTGTQTFAGVKTLSSIPVLSAGLQTFSTAAQSNLNVPSSRSLASTTEGGVQLGGATTTNVRVSIYGSTGATIAANSSYASLVVGANTLTEAASGTNPIIANVGIGILSISNGAGATTNTAGIYIAGAPTGVTPTEGAWALFVDAGTTRLDGGILGTTTNDNATAGNIGEEVVAIQSTYTNYTTTATYQNITSITLTAGDWDISAFMTYSSNSATITAASNAIFVISTTTASAAGATEGRNIAYLPQAALLGTSLFSESISPYRVSISGSTTYYLNTQATFTLGNPQYTGGLRARRIR